MSRLSSILRRHPRMLVFIFSTVLLSFSFISTSPMVRAQDLEEESDHMLLCPVTPDQLGEDIVLEGQGFRSSRQGFRSSRQGFRSSRQGFRSSRQGFRSSRQEGFSLEGIGLDPEEVALEIISNPITNTDLAENWFNALADRYYGGVSYDTVPTAVLMIDFFADEEDHGFIVKQVLEEQLAVVGNDNIYLIPVDLSDPSFENNADLLAGAIDDTVNLLMDGNHPLVDGIHVKHFVLNMSFALIPCTTVVEIEGVEYTWDFPDYQERRDEVLNDGEISHHLECIAENPDGSFTAHLGYRNSYPSPVIVPFNAPGGDDDYYVDEETEESLNITNYLDGGGLKGWEAEILTPAYFGTPHLFEEDPYKSDDFPNSAFQVKFDGSPLYWTLFGETITINPYSEDVDESRPCPDPVVHVSVAPILECVADNGDGTKTAHFGYDNDSTYGVENYVPVEIPYDNQVNRLIGGGLTARERRTLTPTYFGTPMLFEEDPGRSDPFPNSAFQVTFDAETTLRWRLMGTTVSTDDEGVEMCAVVDGYSVGEYLEEIGVPEEHIDEFLKYIFVDFDPGELQPLQDLLRTYINASAATDDLAGVPVYVNVASAGNFAPWFDDDPEDGVLSAPPLIPAIWPETVAVSASLNDSEYWGTQSSPSPSGELVPPGGHLWFFTHDGNVRAPGAGYPYIVTDEYIDYVGGTSFSAPIFSLLYAQYLTYPNACTFPTFSGEDEPRPPLVEEFGYDWSNASTLIDGEYPVFCNINRAPEIGEIPYQTSTEGVEIEPLDLSAFVSDPDETDGFTFFATNLPPGLELDPETGIITGMPSFDSLPLPDYEVEITVQDVPVDSNMPSGSASTTFTWEIIDAPGQCWVDSVPLYEVGTTKGGGSVPSSRQDEARAIGPTDNADDDNFVSLGYGGVIELDFGPNVIYNYEGDDFRVWETTFNDKSRNWSVYPESVKVEVSWDGETWFYVGETTGKDDAYDLSNAIGATVDFIRYIRLTDITSDSPSGDGFDLDAIEGYDCLRDPGGEGGEIVDIPATVEIFKFNDKNGNGEQDLYPEKPNKDELGLQGWTFTLSDTEYQVTTDENGLAVFEELAPGTYEICEEDRDHWNEISGVCQEITVTNGEYAQLAFANTQARLSPVLECVYTPVETYLYSEEYEYTTTSYALFGYNNTDTDVEMLTVPDGDNNKLSGHVEYIFEPGKPTEFDAGRQEGVFWVEFSSDNLVWTLKHPDTGRGGTATAGLGLNTCGDRMPPIVDEEPEPEMTFILVESGDTGEYFPSIMTLSTDEPNIINLAEIGVENVSIAVEIDQEVGSVSFKRVDEDGHKRHRTENIVPYSISGDNRNKGYYHIWQYDLDETYTITATAYSGSGKSGTIIVSETIEITIINEPITPELAVEPIELETVIVEEDVPEPIVNEVPVVDQPADQSSIEGDSPSLTISASDPEGTTLAFAADGLPDGLSINSETGEISGVIAAGTSATGSFEVTVTVTDEGDESSSVTFLWNVAAPNIAPVIEQLTDQENTESDSVSVQIAAIDPELGALRYGAEGLPAGLTINAETGAISGIIDSNAADDSPYSVKIIVIDPEGARTEMQFAWTVNELVETVLAPAPEPEPEPEDEEPEIVDELDEGEEPEPEEPEIVESSFVLVKTDGDYSTIQTLDSSNVINLAEIGTTAVSIAVEFEGVDGIESVIFDGFAVENIVPYSISGDRTGEYRTWSYELNTLYVITATAYSKDWGQGEVLAQETIEVTLINEPIVEEPDEEVVDDEPVDEEVVDDEPVDEEVVDDEPVDEEVVDDEPVDEEPVDDEPVDEEPVDDEPVDEEPVDDEPADDEPADDEPVDDETPTE